MALVLAVISGSSSCDADEPIDLEETSNAIVAARGVVVERTSHGVLHVTASDHDGIGFGVGYAYAEDNRCLLAHRIAQVNGLLSAQLGDVEVRTADNTAAMRSVLMDAFYRSYFDIDEIRAGFAAGPGSVRALAQGYAAGINRYRRDHPELPRCESVDFVADVTVDDVYRMWVATAALGSAEFLAPYLAISESDDGGGRADIGEAPSIRDVPLAAITPAVRAIGSNAWAIGRDALRRGGPLHLYNPHFPWGGIQRLYMLHARIPGELDVMGAALGSFPLPVVGFNRRIAWGITFSTAARSTLMEISLSPDRPLTYRVDGHERQIAAVDNAIEVKDEAEPRHVVFYRSEDGPIVWASSLGLTSDPDAAFVVRDVNVSNTRLVEQWLQIADARSVAEVRSSLEAVQGVPWSNTLATDVAGHVLFGDLSSIPNVTQALVDECGDTPSAAALRELGLFALDGSRAACYWQGRLPADQSPATIRTDYVANGNNNYELPNVSERLTGSSPILGEREQPLSLRASLGLLMIEERLDGSDGLGAPGFTARSAETLLADKRNRAAEVLVDDIVGLCKNPSYLAEEDVTGVCSALEQWDRRHARDSRGAHVFHGMWLALRDQGVLAELFAVPGSLDEPLSTPRGLSSSETVRVAVLDALVRVAKALDDAGVAADARWSEVSLAPGQDGRVFGLPGGPGSQGVFDSLDSISAQTFDGWVESLDGHDPSEIYGSSYTHIVELRPGRPPRARGILSYSQATEPASPWYRDQLELFSSSTLYDLPFTQAEIEADLRSSIRLDENDR